MAWLACLLFIALASVETGIAEGQGVRERKGIRKRKGIGDGAQGFAASVFAFLVSPMKWVARAVVTPAIKCRPRAPIS